MSRLDGMTPVGAERWFFSGCRIGQSGASGTARAIPHHVAAWTVSCSAGIGRAARGGRTACRRRHGGWRAGPAAALVPVCGSAFPPACPARRRCCGQANAMHVGPGPALETPETRSALELLVRLLAHPAPPGVSGQGTQRGGGRKVARVELALAGGAPLPTRPACQAGGGCWPTPHGRPPGCGCPVCHPQTDPSSRQPVRVVARVFPGEKEDR